MRSLITYLGIVLLLFLSACSAGGNSGNATATATNTGQATVTGGPILGAGAAQQTTPVTITLGKTVLAGAVAAQGTLAAGVQSISAEAFLNGVSIAGPVIANAPTATVTINIPNNNGVIIITRTYAGPNATGVIINEGSSTKNLNGTAITLPMVMNLRVGIVTTATQIMRGQTIALTGTVAGFSPPATSPLLWSASAGVITPQDAYGGLASWQAPTNIGTFLLEARINPALNPDQDPYAIGQISIQVIIADRQAPIIIPPADILLEATGVNTAVNLGNAAVTDNIDIGLLASPNNLGPYPLGLTQISWSSTDAIGNTGFALQNVIIQDTTPPVLQVPVDIYINAIAAKTPYANIGLATANDLIFNNNVTITNDTATTYLTGFAVGINPVQWLATDAYGNASSAMQQVIVSDITAPQITTPIAITVPALDAYGTPATNPNIQAFLAAASAIDNVDGVLANIANDAPAQFQLGMRVITFSTQDASGNTAIKTSSINITDQTAPVIAPVSDIYAEATATFSALTITPPVVTDNVDPYVIALVNNAGPYPIGITQLLWTAIDSVGNSSSINQTLIIQDTTAPILSLPVDLYISATGINTPYANIGTATAIDLVFNTNVTITNDTLTTYAAGFPLGDNSVVWTVVDGYGNTSTATQIIIAKDVTPPVLNVPTTQTTIARDIYGAPITDALIQQFLRLAGANDNVDGTLIVSNNLPAIVPIGVLSVTFSAVDNAGNLVSKTTSTLTVNPPPAGASYFSVSDVYGAAIAGLEVLTQDVYSNVITSHGLTDLYGEVYAVLDIYSTYTVQVHSNQIWTSGLWNGAAVVNGVSNIVQDAMQAAVFSANTFGYNRVDMRAKQGGFIAGVVFDPYNQIITNTGVSIISIDAYGNPASQFTILSNPQTGSLATGLPVGQWLIFAEGNIANQLIGGYVDVYGNVSPQLSHAKIITISANQATAQNITLAYASHISGQLFSPAAQPQFIDILLRDLNNGNQYFIQTDATGAYLADVLSGTYQILVNSVAAQGLVGGFFDGNGQITPYAAIAANYSLTVATPRIANAILSTTGAAFSIFAIKPSAVLINVQDTANNPISGMEVSAYNRQTLSRQNLGITNANGQVFANMDLYSNYYLSTEHKSLSWVGGFWTGNYVAGVINIAHDERVPAAIFDPNTGSQTLVTSTGKMLSGSIVDQLGLPVAFAKVRYLPNDIYAQNKDGFFTYADSQGLFNTGVGLDVYSVFVEGVFLDASGSDSALANNLIANDLIGQPFNNASVITMLSGTKVIGTIIDSYGIALTSANVILEPYSIVGVPLAGQMYQTQTDIYGNYAINIPLGQYFLQSDGTHYDALRQANIPITSGNYGGFVDLYGNIALNKTQANMINGIIPTVTNNANLMLQAGGTIKGFITDPNGLGVSQVNMLVSDVYSQYSRLLNTANDGSYEIALPPSVYTIAIDSYSLDNYTHLNTPLAGGLTGGYVNLGIATNNIAAATKFSLTIGAIVQINVQLNVGIPFLL
ncbi:MAG: hypothetical protein R8L53_03835 [Mariprofundales bacterium]